MVEARVVRLQGNGAADRSHPGDVVQLLKATGRSERDVAGVLNYVLGSSFISGEMVAGWAAGLSQPPPPWLQILVDLTQPGALLSLAG